MDTPRHSAPPDAAGHRSGFVAILGRPNVGKSTLLNQLLGQKVAIVTPKPQTTRGRILGIKTLPGAQIVFIDTPGMHAATTLMNRRMVAVAERAMAEADVLLWLVDAEAGVTGGDRAVAAQLRDEPRPLCVVLNKIDRVHKNALLPILATLDALLPGRDVVPVSALRATNCAALLRQIVAHLPPGPPYYDESDWTDQTERMLAQELIREQVLLQTREEVPYAVAVTVDTFEEKPHVTVIGATVHVERATQRAILIGHRGARIKELGRAARQQLEQVLGRRVYLELFVRVQEDWTKHEARLKEFGV